jgi:hypothetical protein
MQYYLFARFFALCQAIKSSNSINKQVPSIAQLIAMNLAKSLIGLENLCSEMAVFGKKSIR